MMNKAEGEKKNRSEVSAPALNRNALWESLKIVAVVIDHEVLLNPSQFSSAIGIKLVALPCSIREGIGGELCGFEIAVVGCKGCLGPISFHQTTSGGPVISVPQARIDSHGLLLWERNANSLTILEHPYGNVIHQESAKQINGFVFLSLMKGN